MTRSGLELRLGAGAELLLPEESVREPLLLLVGFEFALVLLLPPLEFRDGLLLELLLRLPPELELCEEDEDE